jgi:3-isopropylmalate/(R)-2-methylmalate dehydratase large subunit
MSKTLLDKIWENHVVSTTPDGPDVLYIDTHYIHEVTSPQAFAGLNDRGIKVARPDRTVATADHNVPTLNQHLPITEQLSAHQVDTLVTNCKAHNVELFGLGHKNNGIVHIIGPELGISQPGKTMVCGDSHTATHGAFGAIAFGIGTSEVEMVLATQCLLQHKPKAMRITINGTLSEYVTSKDIILYIISKISPSGGTGYFVEFAGEAIENLSMEARMSICNMSIEMGARGGMIAPDQVTFDYLKDRDFSPKGQAWEKAVDQWKTLPSDTNALFDKEYEFQAKDIKPLVTWGTHPGTGIALDANIPTNSEPDLNKMCQYMGFAPGDSIQGKPVDYVFLGSCTNGRIEDFRQFASLIKGRQKAENVKTYIVPGSQRVLQQIQEERLDVIFEEAGFEMRQPGCSACLAMNGDTVPEGAYCVSTSNRNFEGRQGNGARTMLAGPYVAAAAAITGKITPLHEFL